jgi:translation initiation factor eIF-2B subunit alpha
LLRWYYQVPHPIAAILALTQLMQVSSGKPTLELNSRCISPRLAIYLNSSIATTSSGLLEDLLAARNKLVSHIPSLGVRAGCQLFERFVGFSGAGAVSGRRSYASTRSLIAAFHLIGSTIGLPIS